MAGDAAAIFNHVPGDSPPPARFVAVDGLLRTCSVQSPLLANLLDRSLEQRRWRAIWQSDLRRMVSVGDRIVQLQRLVLMGR
jgi:hypothetical protein